MTTYEVGESTLDVEPGNIAVVPRVPRALMHGWLVLFGLDAAAAGLAWAITFAACPVPLSLGTSLGSAGRGPTRLM